MQTPSRWPLLELSGNNFAWRQKPSRQFTAAQARDQTLLSQYVWKDKAYSS